MNTLLRKILLAAHAGLVVLASAGAQAAPLSLEDVPLFLSSRADPNVLLNMSVETPMGGAAYTDNVGVPAGCAGRINDVLGEAGADSIGACYFPATVYLGYFDPAKCYTTSGAYPTNRFDPVGPATASHSCTGQWSGNFLNWMSMTAVDMFTWTMTGGNRVTDTTGLTVIRRARKQNNNSWFPRKVLTAALNVAPSTVTPFTDAALFFHNTDWGFAVGTTFASATAAAPNRGQFAVDVRVCNVGVGLEANCAAYGGGSPYFKPEGLIQRNAAVKRFGVISYTFDNADTRNGGVLRAQMKYVGPTLPDGTANPAREYGTDGILLFNPDGATGGLDSGVINYVNKFSAPGYKTFDPIGELFYEAVRYFKHLGPTPECSSGLTLAQHGGFQVLTDWEDPIQYRCQKNFIVAINDANPWLDKRLPGTFFTSSAVPTALAANDYGEPTNADTSINVRDLTNQVGAMEGLNGTTWSSTGSWISGTLSGQNDSVGGGVGTWDNSCTDKVVGNLGEVMGTCPSPNKQNSYYIAGLAYYANTTDLRSDFANDRGIQNVSSFVIDTQEFSTNPLDGPKNMLWLAGKYGGFADANADGIPQTAEWDTDNDGLPDNYVLATLPQNLVAGLNRAFAFIDDRTASASSASVNSGSISSETRVFQAKFNSGTWTGQLLSFPVNTDGTLGGQEWDAATVLPAAGSRKITTVNTNGAGVPFQWASLDATRKTQLDPSSDGRGAQRLQYLRGDGSNELQNGGVFRNRPVKLGDIVSSAPAFVGKPSSRFPDTLESIAYSSYRIAKAGRTEMVYTGANDGMLHAFDATSGVEQFAYIPSAVFKNLHQLANVNYQHKYYVDGSPTTRDAFYGSAWHTVLVSGLNKGGQGIYALDVTTPGNLTEANADSVAMWEFNDADTDANALNNDVDLGYTYSRPQVARMANGKWAAIFGNGYNNTEADGAASTTGNAVLYIVDLATGNLERKISTGIGMSADPLGLSRPNGLATPFTADLNGDSIVDYIYAGDLFGNLWKFNVTNASSASWDVAYKSGSLGLPLFTARHDNGTPGSTGDDTVQPITTRPVVGMGPRGAGMVVLFGTGKFLEGNDKDAALIEPQSFYGIIDYNTGTAATDRVLSRTTLVEQEILLEQDFDFGGEPTPMRVTSDNALAAGRGWYMDLTSPVNGEEGEMQVSDSILRNDRIIFTTIIPSGDPCGFGGSSWLMELDALSGARLANSPFDRNNDGEFNDQDNITVTLPDGTTAPVPASAIKSEDGLWARPAILAGSTADYLYASSTRDCSGDPDCTNLDVTSTDPGVGAIGRQSWRQVK